MSKISFLDIIFLLTMIYFVNIFCFELKARVVLFHNSSNGNKRSRKNVLFYLKHWYNIGDQCWLEVHWKFKNLSRDRQKFVPTITFILDLTEPFSSFSEIYHFMLLTQFILDNFFFIFKWAVSLHIINTLQIIFSAVEIRRSVIKTKGLLLMLRASFPAPAD